MRALMVKLYELDQPPKLDLRKKHTIEVVLIVLKYEQILRQRLAESFETALNLAEGVARLALWMSQICRYKFFLLNLLARLRLQFELN